MKVCWLALCLLLTACASVPSPDARKHVAEALARTHNWAAVTLVSEPFDLVAYLPPQDAGGDLLTLYLEGDGLAWIGSTRPSTNPTPSDPIGLRLALAHPEGNAAYLARPCQYLIPNPERCTNRYWTGMRFAPEVIDATNQAIDQLKLRFGARRLILVGYSGGGAVAALAAARRSDVERLITVAGNLDHAAWTRHHRISPLSGSLNPAKEIALLTGLPQLHMVGSQDTLITPALVAGFVSRFPEVQRPTITVIEGFDHRCCWAEAWPRLWNEIELLTPP